MKLLSLLSFFLIIFPPLYAQHTATIDHLIDKIDQSFYEDLSITEKFIDTLLQSALEERDTIAYVKGLLLYGECSIFHNPNAKSLTSLLEAKIILSDKPTRDTLLLAIENAIGEYYYRIEELDSALLVYNNLITEIRQYPNSTHDEHFTLVVSYLFAGAIKKKQKLYNEAIDYYNYAINVEKERAKKENRRASYISTLGRLGHVYNQKGDYTSAIINFKGPIEYFENELKENPAEMNYLGSYLIANQHGISESYLQLNQPDSAIHYLLESFKYPVPNLSYHSKSHVLLGEAYHYKEKEDKAIQSYNAAIKAIEQEYGGKKSITVAETYTSVGDYYMLRDEPQKALEFYQTAIINLVENYDNTTIRSNPTLDNIISKDDLLDVLHKKTTAFYSLWQSKQQEKYALASWETGQIAVELLEDIKKENFAFEQDLLESIERHYGLYETQLEVGRALGPDYIEDLFLLVEKSKTSSLLKNISNQKSNLYSNISPHHLQQERIISKELSRLKEKLHQSKFITYEDTLARIKLKNRIFEKEEQVKQIRITYQKEASFQLISPIYLDINSIQNKLLKKDQALIEYFVGEKNAHAFVIKKDTFFFHKLVFNDHVLSAAGSLKEDVFFKKDSLYIEKAHFLYSSIFKSLKTYDLPDNLIIIPDGILHYIPFDILLEEVPDAHQKYVNYPYLIKKHTFSYCLSSTLLSTLQNKLHAVAPIPQLLSFAPEFHTITTNTDPLLANRDQLNNLMYAIPEIERISKLMNSKIVSGKEASKNKFLEMASKFQYIHLATHGKVDDINSNFSFVAFSNLVDTLNESYKLFTNELNSLNLNSDMVVLSACETGIGQVYKGEGLISLSRGFLAAGTKSVVTTLWSINDRYTSQLVESFYQNLQENRGKDEALRKAKLAYLNNSDNFGAHPKYWAAFIPIGDMSNIDKRVFVQEKSSITYMFGYLCVFALLMGLFFLTKNRN